MPDVPSINRRTFAFGVVLGVGSLGIEQLDLLSHESALAAGVAFVHLQDTRSSPFTFWRGASPEAASREWPNAVFVLSTTSPLLARLDYSRSFAIRWSAYDCRTALDDIFGDDIELWTAAAQAFLDTRLQHRLSPAS